MITQVRIDGFKSFLGFQVDVPPVMVMLGLNGAGKSNFFDALRLVAGTAQQGFERTVAADRRLAARDLFHRGGPDGRPLREEFTIEVGMLVRTEDGPLPLRIRLRARYEAGVGRRPGRAVLAARGSAVWISSLRNRDWMDRLGLDAELREAIEGARNAFVRRTGADYLIVGGRLGFANVDESERAASSTGTIELLGLVAQECASWQPLLLDPDSMRGLVPVGPDAPLEHDGRNLPLVLDRIEGQDPTAWRRLVADLAGLVEGVRDVRPRFLESRQEFDYEVEFEHSGWTAPPLLSDGTVRMLALLAAAADPLRRGTLCVEEIENGMHPTRVADLVRRLRRGCGVDGERAGAPYRQLIASTHSPALLAALRTDLSGSLIFMEQADRVDPDRQSVSRISLARPLRARDLEQEPGKTMTPQQVDRLLRRLGQGA
ncbi:AAA family ATPase [Streptomyces palmae]|uniref:ATP-binding protein n=1 Tax=Streptomyces palmae TaxID=1701085 RepID=A0A4Z0GI38_9ACTN|nr:ATP-binding protein [Streptomyces palmae]TGA95289.1 ATP-binding protein [Streptomyces palmae]